MEPLKSGDDGVDSGVEGVDSEAEVDDDIMFILVLKREIKIPRRRI